jgi:hypothetical protein
MSAATGGIVLRLILATLLAQGSDDEQIPPDMAEHAKPTQTWKQAVDFTQRVKELGPWQDQMPLINQMVDSMFTQNNWTSEPDVFARNLILQTASLPPWDVRGRIETFTNIVATRYQLNPQQQEELRQRVWRDAVRLTTQSFPALLPTLTEMLQTRLEGRPFTPEQVSRWMRNTRPIMNRNMTYIQRSLTEFRTTLDPRQQALLDSDVAAADRRAADTFSRMEDWANGKWTPKDWGLERDPIHAQAQPAGEPVVRPGREDVERRMERARPAAEVVVSRDLDQWERYVQQFIGQYKLDAAQQTSAWSIYADVKARADQWRASHADELAELEATVREAADAAARQDAQQQLDGRKQPLAEMFAELQQRLENLLTNEQRACGSDSAGQAR